MHGDLNPRRIRGFTTRKPAPTSTDGGVMNPRSRTVFVGVVSALFLASTATYFGTGNTSVIRGCVDDRTGALRVIDRHEKCGRRETPVEWNRQGPQGPQGPRGHVGPRGAQGAPGKPGAAGPAGRAGAVGPIGLQGPAGPQGPAGAQGPAGPQGEPGPAGPQGPAGPAGSSSGAGNLPPASTGLRVVDNLGEEIGLFIYPNAAAVEVGADVVFAAIDQETRAFAVMAPPRYYASPGCTGPALMHVGLARFGYVEGGMLHYPMGAATLTPYASYEEDGSCSAFAGATTLATAGQTPISQFVAPFAVVK